MSCLSKVAYYKIVYLEKPSYLDRIQLIGMNTYSSVDQPVTTPRHWVGFTLGMFVLVLANDLLESVLKNYSYYITESALFGVFWLLFLPLILGSRKVLNGKFFTSRILQVFLLGMIHITVFAFLVHGISALFYSYTYTWIKVSTYALTENGITCLLVYGVVSFLPLKPRPKPLPIRTSSSNLKIAVNHHNKSIVLNRRDVLYVKSEKPYIALVTKDKKYLYKSTLKDFLAQDPTGKFIQVHKSTIINAHYIIAYTSRKNGDYDIEMANQQLIRASRNYKSNFASHLN